MLVFLGQSNHVAIDMDQSRRLVGHGRRTATFAIQQRHLAEKLPRSMLVEDKLLALRRVDHNQDASREHAVETVRRVVTEEDNLVGGNHPAAGAPQQRPSLAIPQRAENRVPSQEVVWCHRRYPRTGSAAGGVTWVTQRSLRARAALGAYDGRTNEQNEPVLCGSHLGIGLSRS